jgi:hypothetical protein
MPRHPFNSWMLIAGMLSGTAICWPQGLVTAGELLHPHRRPLPNVPPIDELEILDPRVDPEGKPRAQVLPGANGLSQVVTPPTIIVHRYYYTGDRDFQGPMLQGGPTLLTANDPATGEQVQVEALLPPGAPRIRYRSDKITYVYRDRSITLCFGHPGPLGIGRIGKPAIVITHHSALHHTAVEKTRYQAQHREWWARTGIPAAATEVTTTSKSFVNHAADTVHTVGDTATAPIKAVWRATPLSSLTNSQERQPDFNATFNR